MVAGGGMLMLTAFAPLLYQPKQIYGGGYNAASGLILRDIAHFTIGITKVNRKVLQNTVYFSTLFYFVTSIMSK